MEMRFIVTDPVKGGAGVRVDPSRKISDRALELVKTVFCSCLAQKELRLLEFLLSSASGRAANSATSWGTR